MQGDIEFEKNNIKFKVRVNGILINDGKVLTVQMYNNNFYCLPGGHIIVGEDSKTAVEREFFEETKILVKANKLISIIENFFVRKNGMQIHEVGFYYLLEAKEKYNIIEEYSLIENDNGEKVKLNFKWIDILELEKNNFKPTTLIRQFKDIDNFEKFKHYIIK
jgi:ADP-ribose pyrophosphatase YjhB (NUDIX family)